MFPQDSFEIKERNRDQGACGGAIDSEDGEASDGGDVEQEFLWERAQMKDLEDCLGQGLEFRKSASAPRFASQLRRSR